MLNSDLPSIGIMEFTPPARFRSGIDVIDALFQDRIGEARGLARGSVSLLTGRPGLGKTTLLMQILDGLAMNGCLTMISSNEMNKNAIVGMAKAFDLKYGPHFAFDQQFSSRDLATRAESIAELHAGKQLVLAIDSVQGLDLDVSNPTARAWENIEECSRRSGAIILLLNHLRKDNIMAGAAKILQRCDAILEMVESESGVAGELDLVVEKNRHGPVATVSGLVMTKTGILTDRASIRSGTPDPDDTQPGTPAKAISPSKQDITTQRLWVIEEFVATCTEPPAASDIFRHLQSKGLADDWNQNAMSQAIKKTIAKGLLNVERVGEGAATRYRIHAKAAAEVQ